MKYYHGRIRDLGEHDFHHDWKCISKMYAPEGYHQRETVTEWRQKPLGTRNEREKEREWEKQKTRQLTDGVTKTVQKKKREKEKEKE